MIFKYFRILRLFWQTSLAGELEYRLNFIVTALTSFGNFIGSLFTLSLLYSRNHTFEGWNWSQALLVTSIFSMLEGLAACLLYPNLNRIVMHVQQGTLDFVLLKPIDSQFWISTRQFSPWGLPTIAFGLILMFYAGVKLQLHWSSYLMALVPIILSMLILYSLWFILCTTTMWFTKIYNVSEVLRTVSESGRYPIAAYPTVYRFFLTFIVPVAFMTTVPAEALLGRASWIFLLAQAGICVAVFMVARAFWKFALRSYTSASS